MAIRQRQIQRLLLLIFPSAEKGANKSTPSGHSVLRCLLETYPVGKEKSEFIETIKPMFYI